MGNLGIKKGEKIVIIGGGFAGLQLAKTLRKADLKVILVDKQNHHQFQPLFYQVIGRIELCWWPGCVTMASNLQDGSFYEWFSLRICFGCLRLYSFHRNFFFTRCAQQKLES